MTNIVLKLLEIGYTVSFEKHTDGRFCISVTPVCSGHRITQCSMDTDLYAGLNDIYLKLVK